MGFIFGMRNDCAIGVNQSFSNAIAVRIRHNGLKVVEFILHCAEIQTRFALEVVIQRRLFAPSGLTNVSYGCGRIAAVSKQSNRIPQNRRSYRWR